MNNTSGNRPLKIAFLGRNEQLTRVYFRDFAEANREQIRLCDFNQGRVVLNDGTEIYRASTAGHWMLGRRFDQVLIADDRRPGLFGTRFVDSLYELDRCCAASIIPEEFRAIWYNPDADMKGETRESYLQVPPVR